jgi:hypothetical protein
MLAPWTRTGEPQRYNRSDWNLLFKLAAAPGSDKLSRFLNNFGHPLPNGKRDLNNGGVLSTDCTGCSWEYPDANYTRQAAIVQHHKTCVRRAGSIEFDLSATSHSFVSLATVSAVERWVLLSDGCC